MLGSITPLGERGRGQRWWITVTANVIGSGVAGAAFGGLVGVFGGWVLDPLRPSNDALLAVLAVAITIAAAADLFLGRDRIPGPRRQVDETWLTRYRGWVYGLAFGAQLGIGMATVVSTAAVYATFFAAFISGSSAGGATIGAVFGMARAATLLLVARVRTTDRVLAVDARLRAWETPARRTALVGMAALALATFVITTV
jgi:hypothetical protein